MLGSSHLEYIVVRSSALRSIDIPMASRFCSINADCFGYGAAASVKVNMPSHTLASHTPSWSLSYFDCAISSFAFVRSPAPFGDGYGS